MVLVAVDTASVEKARPLFKNAVDLFKSHLPGEFWKIADGLEKIFEGYATGDSSLLIEAWRELAAAQNQSQADGNTRELGVLLVATGEYEEGKELLSRFVSGEFESTSAWTYLISQYYIGIANEGLGRKQEAIANYREVLRFWSNPDRDLKEITDTRERLARLTS
jgi:tetratricopeptide (TPR) repeat protein